MSSREEPPDASRPHDRPFTLRCRRRGATDARRRRRLRGNEDDADADHGPRSRTVDDRGHRILSRLRGR